MSTASIVILIVVVLLVAIIAALAWKQHRTRQLSNRFGPEYGQALKAYGTRSKAEQSLLERQKRMEKLQIRPLSPADRDRFAEQWVRAQATFVDDPVGSIREADRLVCEAMQARGYPM